MYSVIARHKLHWPGEGPRTITIQQGAKILGVMVDQGQGVYLVLQLDPMNHTMERTFEVRKCGQEVTSDRKFVGAGGNGLGMVFVFEILE